LNKLPEKSKRFALVIGIDRYQNRQITGLSGAVNDARTLCEALINYAGFPRDQVVLLASDQSEDLRPTRSAILKYFSNLRGLVPQDGLLLVAYAGHGIEREGRAYLMPMDALMSDDVSLLEDTSINIERVKSLVRATQVKQVMIILDACRNDPAAGRSGGNNPMTEAFRRGFSFDMRNREVTAFVTLYATAVGHRAYEYAAEKQGYFTWALVEALKGKAANEKSEVTLGSLIKYVQEVVPKYVQRDHGAQQRPFAEIGGYKADELVLAIAAPPAVATSTAAPASRPRPGPDSNRPSASNTPSAPSPAKSVKLSPPSPLANYDFNVLTVNSSGFIANREQRRVRYFNVNVSGTNFTFVAIPGGTFMMGSAESEVEQIKRNWSGSGEKVKELARVVAAETPQHQVSIADFFMQDVEVTQAQWRAVARLPKVNRDLITDPSKFKGDNLPVEQVTWEEAIEFCERLSRALGWRVRLPSEAEWEYGCRAGTNSFFHFGDTITPEVVNYNANHHFGLTPADWRRMGIKGYQYRDMLANNRGQTTPVGGLKRPNRFAMSDMHGNVWEWCQDVWHDNYLGAPADGGAWIDGVDTKSRVLRGGAWNSGAGSARSATRAYGSSTDKGNHIGFRIVATLEKMQ
jgi:formylglycine-generating enzyme required for sulfatase activity/uncharacterized caspase-like protein